MKIVIRAGGIGTRLWPLSRISNPKQFQKIFGSQSMIRATFERIAPLLEDSKDLFISVNAAHASKIQREIPEIDASRIIIETETRNTGPAMCLEVCYLERLCDKKDVIASIPSDDYIANSTAFCQLLRTSEKFILRNPEYVLTPAVEPIYSDIGYSYFKAGKNLQASGEEAIYEIVDVVEKPNKEYLKELIASGVYYAHTGMYIWQLRSIINQFKKFQPAMYSICAEITSLLLHDMRDLVAMKELYNQLEAITIESALTDKIEKLAMSVSNKIGWSDLGKWHIVKKIYQKGADDNVIKGRVMTEESTNNLIYSSNAKKVIVVNDAHNLSIIDTDDVLFISSLKNSAEVKRVVDKLKSEGMDEYL